MDRKEFIRLTGFFLAGTFFSCQKSPTTPIEEKPENYTLTDIVESNIINGLDRPEWVSDYPIKTGISKSINQYTTGINVFCENPLFNGPPVTDFEIRPKILKFTEDEQTILAGGEISLYHLSELTSAITNDFDTGWVENYTFNEKTILRPRGLSIDAVVLEDNSVLVSSNVSKKIFEIDESGIDHVYLEDDELIGITNMILGSDGKIYCAQLPLIDPPNNIIRPKRVISVDSQKNINIEFELPIGTFGGTCASGLDNTKYAGNCLPMDTHLKIIENTNIGEDKPSKFYVTDLLTQVVYGISQKGDVSILANLRYPSSVAIDNYGKLFVTTSPLLSLEREVSHYPELFEINPETEETTLLHSFTKDSNSYRSGIAEEVIIEGQKYLFPTNFTMYSALFENEAKFVFIYTNSLTGTFNKLDATKG